MQKLYRQVIIISLELALITINFEKQIPFN